MNIKNLLGLTVRAMDFNMVARQPELVASLRRLTLDPDSGLNFELDRMLLDAQTRFVNCQVILANRFGELVGWAILSKETTDYNFMRSGDGFNSESGVLFQVYIDPPFRRQGIASEIYKKARELSEGEVLHVCPWDYGSTVFFEQFEDENTKWL